MSTDRERVGAIVHPPGGIPLAKGRERKRLTATNRSQRPLRVSSHYPFWLLNHRLEFDREAARGFRLDLPAGSSLAWEPGQTREVDLVAYAGTSGR